MELTKVKDVIRLLSFSNSQMKPKRITLDLSEDGTYYNTRIYVDLINKDKDESYEGYVDCKTNIPSFINDFDLVYDFNKEDEEIFTITIPDEVYNG